MSAADPTPIRPQSVTMAFWCWVVGAVLLAALGLWQLSLNIPIQFRAIGGLLVLVGLTQSFLAGRARRGDSRFRRAAAALAMATVLLIVLLLLVFGTDPLGLLVLVGVMALSIAGTVLITRPVAQQWFDGEAHT